MATQVQNRRGTTAEHSTFTGANGELTVDTTKRTLVVHDGATAGGRPLLREDQSNLPTSAPTTGIYNASGSLAISTGGSGRLFVDASGNVKLGSNAASSFRLAVDGDTWLGNSAGAEIGRLFNDSGVLCLRASSNVTGLGLATNSSSSHAIRITAAGLVGVGTSSPGDVLHVKGGSTYAGVIADNSAATGGGAFRAYRNGVQKAIFCVDSWVTGTSSDDAAIYADAGGGIKFYTNNSSTAKAVLTSGGSLGIGTTDASSLFSSSRNVRLSNASGKVSYEASVADGTNNHRVGLFVDNATGDLGLDTGSSTGSYNGLSFYIEGSKRATIDRSGRLLVGTSSSPSAGLGQYALAVVQGYAGSTTGEGILSIARGKAATALVNTDTVGQIAFTDNAGNTFAKIVSFVDGTVSSTSDLPGALSFSTTADGASSPTERMRIGQNGTVDTYGTPTESAYTARVSHGSGTDYGFFSGRHSATSTSTGTNTFFVYTNGNVVNTNNSYGQLSDIKLKENISDANSQWNDIKAIEVKNFNFIDDATRQIGVIAQQVEQVSPGLVDKTPDRDEDGNDLGTVTKSVKYSVLYMKAVKALQEAMERIESLESRLTAAGI